MSDLVTGEAVAVDLQIAKLASRSVAVALDIAVQAPALTVLFVVLVMGPGVDSALSAAVGLVVAVAVLVGYPVVAETLTRGRTLGKMALGLRVVRDDGGPISFRHALVRGLAWFFVDFWALGVFGFVAMAVSLSSTKGKRVGDFLAGTVVIRERVPGRVTTPAPMPPQLAGWASELDLSRLTDRSALTVRQFLGRIDQLHAGVRDEMGGRLADEVWGLIGTPPPPGTSSRDYLAAVLAERRAREEAKAFPAADATARRAEPAEPVGRAQQPPRPQGHFTPPS